MAAAQMKVFVCWVLTYVVCLAAVRKMWSSRYLRSHLSRSLYMNMLSHSQSPPYWEGGHQVRAMGEREGRRKGGHSMAGLGTHRSHYFYVFLPFWGL